MTKDIQCNYWTDLHNYEETIADTDYVLVERCTNCGHKILFNKVGGRIDNKRYLETHQIWFLQPSHRLYERYYGKVKAPPPQNKYAKMCVEEKAYHYAEELNKGVQDTKKQHYSAPIK